MSKKNNKNSIKQQKIEQSQQKNNYIKNLSDIFKRLNLYPAFQALSHRELDCIYNLRFRPAKIVCADDSQVVIDEADLKILNSELNKFLHENEFEIGDNKNHFTFYEIITYLETILFVSQSIILNKNHVFHDMMIDKYFTMDEFIDILTTISYKIEKELVELAWFYSEINNNLLSFKIYLKEYDKNTHKFENLFRISAAIQKVKQKTLDIDGYKRNIYHIGLIKNTNIEWMKTSPENYKNKGLLGVKPFNIFIQTHVLERIKERLNETAYKQSYIIIVVSLMMSEVIQTNSHNYLFEVWIKNIKVGYLKATIIDDFLLLRTFLFITNNGTPEGEKLSEMLGINKDDKKYLSIDKMNTFINSDIEENEAVKNIFTQAGCGDLFKLKKSIETDPEHTFKCADYLHKYFELDNETPENIKLKKTSQYS